MKRFLLFITLIVSVFSPKILFGQEHCFKSAPFNSGIIEAIYSKQNSKVFCKIHFDNYGERYSLDLSKNEEDENAFQSIIRKDGYWFYIQHNKKEVLKVPEKEVSPTFDTTQLKRVSDTVFNGYNSRYYTGSNDSLVAIYYYDLLLYMRDLQKNITYEVTAVSENESFPEFVFFLPRGFTLTEMNYNFSE